jgi:hypothetical protein
MGKNDAPRDRLRIFVGLSIPFSPSKFQFAASSIKVKGNDEQISIRNEFSVGLGLDSSTNSEW